MQHDVRNHVKRAYHCCVVPVKRRLADLSPRAAAGCVFRHLHGMNHGLILRTRRHSRDYQRIGRQRCAFGGYLLNTIGGRVGIKNLASWHRSFESVGHSTAGLRSAPTPSLTRRCLGKSDDSRSLASSRNHVIFM